MAEKIVKVCDCCGTESILFNTAQWAKARFSRLVMGNPEGESVEYDLCNECAAPVQCCAFGSPDALVQRLASLKSKSELPDPPEVKQ